MALTGMLFLIGAAFAAPTLSAATPFELERARETLKISQAARDRIAGELSDLKASGNASPEVLSAYETYLARVQEMVDENQKALAQMEAAYSAHQARPQAARPAIAGAAQPSAGPGEDPADRLKVLDRQFNESLASFDEMLLKELRLIQAASAKRMQGLSEAAAEAGRQAGEKGEPREKGSTTETAGSGTAGGGSEKGGAGTEQAKTSEGSGKPGAAAGSGQGAGGGATAGAPAGSYTPSPDDDIVARQLREAAEKETDPDLKAKLWKEYEAYKRSRAKP